MMRIDRKKVENNFKRYTEKYDLQDLKIQLKAEHTFHVAELCDQIARSLALSEEDVDLAWLMGMLHDLGRFEQLRQYGTFSDADSVDHAALAVKLLFEEGLIEEYLPASMLYENGDAHSLLRTAIANHSAYRLEQGLSRREEQFCHILRDADKLDIFRVIVEKDMDEIYHFSPGQLAQSGVTEEVAQAFREHHAVLRSLKKKPADYVVGNAALAFELVFPISRRLAIEQGYLKKILAFSSDNPETRKIFAELCQCMWNYLMPDHE